MDAFVAMRHFMMTNAEVFQRLSTMEYHQLEMQQHFLKMEILTPDELVERKIFE